MHERMLIGYFVGPRRYLSLLGVIPVRSTKRQIVTAIALTLRYDSHREHTFGNVVRWKAEVQRSVTLYIGGIGDKQSGSLPFFLVLFVLGPSTNLIRS